MIPAYLYVAFFVDPEELYGKTRSLRKDPLPCAPSFPHVTVAYKPETVDRSLFGKKAEITITGYGNNGKNEGVSVRLQIKDEQLAGLASAIAVPHITLSTAPDAKASETARLAFRKTEPIVLKGVFGGVASGLERPVLRPARNRKRRKTRE